jgi:hypothetical protein
MFPSRAAYDARLDHVPVLAITGMRRPGCETAPAA